MSLGNYGFKRPADVNPSDIEVIVIYSRTRASGEQQVIKKLSGSTVIRPLYSNQELGGNTSELLGGLYNLTLPKDVFNQKGIYTIYIRPAQIRTTILDCGELVNVPDIRGLVFDVNSAPVDFIRKFTNNGLDGYRVEYLNNNGSKIEGLYKIVTTSFLCEATQSIGNGTTQKGIKYAYNNTGSLLFCTVTPNTAPSFRPTAQPFIGRKGQNVILSNTSFNPIVKEIEVVDFDIESLSIALFGEQSKSLKDGIYTLYNTDGTIYKQYDLYEIDDPNIGHYEVRRIRTDIDSSKSLDNIPLPN